MVDYTYKVCPICGIHYAMDKVVADYKRSKERVHAGVCPCCSRTFVNLQRHMKSKHPNVTPIKRSATT